MMEKFLKLASQVHLTALDIGARGGPNNDLIDLAPAIDMNCFEPDEEEYARLLQNPKEPWKTIQYIPSAVSSRDETFSLNLYRQRGCSSKYTADVKTAALFNRDDYYIHDGSVNVAAKSLDQLIIDYQINTPAFLKIDVQGMEMDVFAGGTAALTNSIVGIRAEVSLFPMYHGNPLFSEISNFLSLFNFVPMRWLELHEWRRNTKIKWPKTSQGKMLYSRGQMIHGDILFLLHPENLSDTTDDELKRLIRLALISICYEQYDHAYAVFTRDKVRDYIIECAGFDPIHELEALSKQKAGFLSSLNRFRRNIARQF
ncbi:FkbM family methyltransferase [Methanocalculus sp. AMF5]|uniref:FkbM family methyltransferase n=1 Tax=Methanocalculus sp. AMF5 TaxID=1198257 RepID=UPI0020A0D591|nr:FkbM family methyltransferase [Methanocalculus sp. AMF5]MCP1663165.1 FkbM family methyltransferase [Methanocalculus sp. AMF5]